MSALAWCILTSIPLVLPTSDGCVRADPRVGWSFPLGCGTTWPWRTLERPGKQGPCGSKLPVPCCTQQRYSFSDVASHCLCPPRASRLHGQRCRSQLTGPVSMCLWRTGVDSSLSSRSSSYQSTGCLLYPNYPLLSNFKPLNYFLLQLRSLWPPSTLAFLSLFFKGGI